ncbi:MAG: hybrid sensor histidine kinase/response regulator [Giesbergeria sp.]|nr:hybrid sensor histidine kinase/response regulator [Giesbergeria sp.]
MSLPLYVWPQHAWRALGRLAKPECSEVLAEQVLLLRRSFPMTLVASLLTSGGALLMLSLVMPLHIVLGWFCVHLLVVAGVYLALRRLPRPDTTAHQDARRLTVCMAVMGLMWGSLGLLVWQFSDSINGVIYYVGILSAVSSGALGLGAPMYRAYLAYLSCTVGGALTALLLTPAPVALAGAVMVLAYYALTCLHAYNLAQAARRSILLKFDNQRLVVELRAQTHHARQAQEVAEKASQDKSHFLAAASHDLRQPLHAIGLFLEALQRSALSEHQTLVLGHARAASGAAAEMLSTLLDYSRLEAGVVKARRTSFAVQPLLQALEQEFGAEADTKELYYRTRETSAAAFADRSLVDLVMRNLISNALRYTHCGGVLIACRVRSGRLALEVWDSGSGIAPEHLQDIFKEFHQLGNSERDRRKGLGLGLAIVQRLVTEMGAQLQVQSRPGRGSVFRLWLDSWQGALLLDDTNERPTHSNDGADLTQLRIWVIDDDETVCLAMQALLYSWGCLCRTAASAQEVLARVHSQAAEANTADTTNIVGGDDAADWSHASAPDLIVTDFRLRHEQTGRDVLAALRRHWGTDIPAIILTGDTSPQRLRDAQSTAALLLHKPVSSHELRHAISTLVQR